MLTWLLALYLACVDLFSLQIQSKHFMSTSVSIEGYTVHYKLNELDGGVCPELGGTAVDNFCSFETRSRLEFFI